MTLIDGVAKVKLHIFHKSKHANRSGKLVHCVTIRFRFICEYIVRLLAWGIPRIHTSRFIFKSINCLYSCNPSFSFCRRILFLQMKNIYNDPINFILFYRMPLSPLELVKGKAECDELASSYRIHIISYHIRLHPHFNFFKFKSKSVTFLSSISKPLMFCNPKPKPTIILKAGKMKTFINNNWMNE